MLQKNEMDSINSPQVAVLGGGCFWCIEAIFAELRGVVSVMPGYAGGPSTHSIKASTELSRMSSGQASSGQVPTYEQVCNGQTGHAEVSKIEYDSTLISYDDLLTVFFATHDPTTLNRQGNDVGTQYRSIILYTTPEQKTEAEAFIAELNKAGQRVVTELKPLDKFYPAEEYHREYFKKNPDQAYCQVVISPKLDKLKEKFYKLLK